MAEEEIRDIRVAKIPTEGPPSYSNFVNVNHGPHDFRITFGLTVLPIGGLKDDENEIQPSLAADVIVPASEMPLLIEVLSRNYATWERTYGVEDEKLGESEND